MRLRTSFSLTVELKFFSTRLYYLHCGVWVILCHIIYKTKSWEGLGDFDQIEILWKLILKSILWIYVVLDYILVLDSWTIWSWTVSCSWTPINLELTKYSIDVRNFLDIENSTSCCITMLSYSETYLSFLFKF